MPIRLFLFGYNGRMGQAVRNLASSHNATIVGGFGTKAQDLVYTDISSIPNNFDCILDFSSYSCLETILSLSKTNNTPVVIASTGHTHKQLDTIKRHSKSIAVFQSPNMSIGIGVLIDMLQIAHKQLPSFDIEIIEMHHNRKHDTPSGTAKMMTQALGTADITVGRRQEDGTRQAGQIGMHSVRGGASVGQHTAILFGDSETITISHQTHSRNVFAQGALHAARFVSNKNSGYYTVKDLMEV